LEHGFDLVFRMFSEQQVPDIVGFRQKFANTFLDSVNEKLKNNSHYEIKFDLENDVEILIYILQSCSRHQDKQLYDNYQNIFLNQLCKVGNYESNLRNIDILNGVSCHEMDFMSILWSIEFLWGGHFNSINMYDDKSILKNIHSINDEANAKWRNVISEDKKEVYIDNLIRSNLIFAKRKIDDSDFANFFASKREKTLIERFGALDESTITALFKVLISNIGSAYSNKYQNPKPLHPHFAGMAVSKPSNDNDYYIPEAAFLLSDLSKEFFRACHLERPNTRT